MGNKSRWPDYESWREFGIANEYDNNSPTEMRKSENELQKSWFIRGMNKKWVKDFDFTRKILHGMWKTQDEWQQHGIDNGYEGRNPNELFDSENNLERSWYHKGGGEGWLDDFSLTRLRPIRWKTKDEWQQHGEDNDYDQVMSTSLRDDKNEIKRSWYDKGKRNGWLKNFEFKVTRERPGKWKDLEFTLEYASTLLENEGVETLGSQTQLYDLGHANLSNAIIRYHGGIRAFREKLREYIVMESDVSQIESLLEEYVGGEE